MTLDGLPAPTLVTSAMIELVIGSALVAVILLDRKSRAERKEGGF